METSWTDLRGLLLSAGRFGTRPAIWINGTCYSYHELLTDGGGIAAAIVDGARRRTAVLADRRYWSYVGIVGTLLAGHAYVPLNPRHPVDRLETILHSAQVGALIIQGDLLDAQRDLIERMPACRIVVPDASQVPGWARQTAHTWRTASELGGNESYDAMIYPHDGAYLLFTSGSTGAPKGVMVSHRNVTSYLHAALARYRLAPEDRTTQLFDLTFDLSVHDLFVTWAAGATLYVPSENARRAPRQFVQQHRLTCWFSTPSTASFMSRLRMLTPGSLESLRLSLFCGEALPTRLVREWQRAAPNSVVENLYGPTEATIAFTVFNVPADSELPEIVPIGTPLPHQQAEVFDGELCLSGSQITDGYWQQPELTEARFVWRDGQRWYRTGDRAERSAFGLQYLGRIDRQVKISGHRVELTEIETVMRRAAATHSVAVVPWPMDNDGLAHGVIGFIAADAESDAKIMQVCRAALPQYMQPGRLIRLVEWPLNVNGKTDYHLLLQELTGGTKDADADKNGHGHAGYRDDAAGHDD